MAASSSSAAGAAFLQMHANARKALAELLADEPGEAVGESDEPSGPVVLPVPPPAELAVALEREEAAQEAQASTTQP